MVSTSLIPNNWEFTQSCSKWYFYMYTVGTFKSIMLLVVFGERGEEKKGPDVGLLWLGLFWGESNWRLSVPGPYEHSLVQKNRNICCPHATHTCMHGPTCCGLSLSSLSHLSLSLPLSFSLSLSLSLSPCLSLSFVGLVNTEIDRVREN